MAEEKSRWSGAFADCNKKYKFRMKKKKRDICDCIFMPIHTNINL